MYVVRHSLWACHIAGVLDPDRRLLRGKKAHGSACLKFSSATEWKAVSTSGYGGQLENIIAKDFGPDDDGSDGQERTDLP